jgi:hypothetical protein
MNNIETIMTNNTNISSTKNKAITIRNKTNKTNPSYQMRGKEVKTGLLPIKQGEKSFNQKLY